jgi:phosphomannomutase
MRKTDVLIGGEDSGGLSVKGHIPEKDGILASLLTIEMMAVEKKPLSHIWTDLQQEAGLHLVSKRIDLRLTPGTQRGLIDALSNQPFEKIGQAKVEKVGRADGFKFYLDSSNWVLVRTSGTEPLVRLHFEGTSEEKVAQTMSDFQKQIDAIVENLSKVKETAR